jgi:1-pyrroline-4-hydroxy-2-carboxylate deaminase
MWKGTLPAVTTRFAEDGGLDHVEMERCLGGRLNTGIDGLIVAGTLGEGAVLAGRKRRADAEAIVRRVIATRRRLPEIAGIAA